MSEEDFVEDRRTSGTVWAKGELWTSTGRPATPFQFYGKSPSRQRFESPFPAIVEPSLA